MVACDEDCKLVGCGALHFVWDRLAEIRSLAVGDTAIEVAAYESVEVSIITTAADASEYDSSYTGKLCVVTSHAIKWD